MLSDLHAVVLGVVGAIGVAFAWTASVATLSACMLSGVDGPTVALVTVSGLLSILCIGLVVETCP